MSSVLRPELRGDGSRLYCPVDGTAYLLVYNAVQARKRLCHGKLHCAGDSCAIGSFFDANGDKMSLKYSFIDEVAAVNDSAPHLTGAGRRRMVLKWLRWKLNLAGMPGFKPRKKTKKK